MPAADGASYVSVSVSALACLAASSAALAALGAGLLVWRCLEAQLGAFHDVAPKPRASWMPSGWQCSCSSHQGNGGKRVGGQAAPLSGNPTLIRTGAATLLLGSHPKRLDPTDPSPRSGYLQWDDYFMALAFLSAQRSKDPSKQVGAVIVGPNKVILGIGYNGFPRGCSDDALPWAKVPPSGSDDPLETKYPFVVHAEANALLNKNTASITGASIYVTMFPCNECAKLLIQAGITEVVYHEEKVQERVGGDPQAQDEPSAAEHGTDSAQDHVTQQRTAAADACYRASHKLLKLAGVRLRQHKLLRPIILGPLP